MDLLDDRYTSICNLSIAYIYTIHKHRSKSPIPIAETMIPYAPARLALTSQNQGGIVSKPQGPGIMRRIYIGPAISMTS